MKQKMAAPQQCQEKNTFFLVIVFGLHYVAFGEDRLRLNNVKKKIQYFLVIVFGLHYLCAHYGLIPLAQVEVKPLI